MQRARSKLLVVKDVGMDYFHSTKALFEQHKLVFTIGTSILSAGAAWTGYAARQLHQKHVEERLNSIEHRIKTQQSLEGEDLKFLTKTGISFKTAFATMGTTAVITYVLGWRAGRKFTLKQIVKQQQKLLAGKSNYSRVSQLKRSLADMKTQRLAVLKQKISALRQVEKRRKKEVEDPPSPEVTT